MILHTVIDPAEVMLNPSEPPPTYEYRRRNGCLLQCIRREDGLYLDRIISTDPKDYLNSAYQIGAILPKEAP